MHMLHQTEPLRATPCRGMLAAKNSRLREALWHLLIRALDRELPPAAPCLSPCCRAELRALREARDGRLVGDLDAATAINQRLSAQLRTLQEATASWRKPRTTRKPCAPTSSERQTALVRVCQPWESSCNPHSASRWSSYGPDVFLNNKMALPTHVQCRACLGRQARHNACSCVAW